MAKIGRNERCPCGSGKKYKHCCARTPVAAPQPASPEEQLRISLMGAVQKICAAAEQKKKLINELGVFVLFSTTQGNSWLLEVTQSDCVQLAADGNVLASPIDENPETIEIEWSHTYKVINKELVLTGYKDRQESVLADCPVKEVSASIRRVAKKIPPEMLGQIHLDAEKLE